MGRTLANKKEIVAELKELLTGFELALVIDYKGLSVAEITDLRNRLSSKGAVCKVTKNTLMRIAVEGDDNWQPIQTFLKDASAFVLVKDDLGGAIKEYQAFQKDTKKTVLRGGVMEGQALDENDIKAITDLPSKEELIARIAGAINAVPTKLGVGLNAVPTKLAVGIKEVPASLTRAIKAVSEQEES
ncbi:50S ribosomal protein L10 [Halomicronema hongdechloris C2206]|uniref:Large ribosomal subunit protein uL10 n=1 Tax=Halomicronema hongdechloris C2206 TaxID=1641165 RepID=A0A1Z3HSH6_9CYAN|nr:50S ribosomal protein L10 [Halomicronema hongdechloris]ASC73259.1 50S ribosomal protein L10 [Halomicronema hongdechloris C2206]